MTHSGLDFAARLLVIGGLASACVRRPPPAPEADARAGPGAGVTTVALERRPCFGTCPVYSVTVDRSGSVRFEGRRFVADTGGSTGSVAPARVDSLIAELEAAGYFGYADRYAMGEPGCERYATDLPTVITTVRIGGRTKRVEHDHGCTEAPAALSILERRIDEVAGVERWVGR